MAVAGVVVCGAAAGQGGRRVNRLEGTRGGPRLQPYVSQAATLCIPGCNPMYPVSTGLRVRVAYGHVDPLPLHRALRVSRIPE